MRAARGMCVWTQKSRGADREQGRPTCLAVELPTMDGITRRAADEKRGASLLAQPDSYSAACSAAAPSRSSIFRIARLTRYPNRPMLITQE